MVVKRKSNGFEFSNIPKAPRSIRRKVSSSKRGDDVNSQISAIDLLASLAGKLLEESESSSTSTYAFEGDNKVRLGGDIKQEHEDDDNYKKRCKSEFYDRGANSVNTSLTSVFDRKMDCALMKPLVGCESKKQNSDLLVESGGITEETCVVNKEAGFEEGDTGLMADTFSLKDPSQVHVQSVHLDGGSFEGYENPSKLVYRDDDENFCKYLKYSEKCKSSRPLTRVGNRKSKKSAMTKYGRSFDNTSTGGYLKAQYRKRKFGYGYKHDTVHRKRRLSDKGLVVNSDGGLSSESVSNSPMKGESGVFSAAVGLHSEDSLVKFSIKSLRIPELFIEVPETATVGSLKRTVMEAVTALLGDGIRIGVLAQGKKVRDDNNTLSQTGLSCRENLSNLGFTLEPGSEILPVPPSPVVSMPTDSERSAGSPALECIEKNQDLVTVHREEQPALVPAMALELKSVESLAIVPVDVKSKRTELSQRRARRPFSVTEVEALVQSVEEHGTGRWRDVKLRSFEDANHRTYVDLKDKWKTLVHTASISPHQRRGEPVPQELLDRVLAAHRYWSQQQLKQNGKHQVSATMAVATTSG